MSDVLLGLAGNPSLPLASVDRLIATADGEFAEALAERPDLTRAQVVALAARDQGAALQLTYILCPGAPVAEAPRPCLFPRAERR
ncbi:hypothetical protein [Actinacidiphila glaucinigra]|uniref:hypothetical protein n=1 Tax=Actinacidiphila glaucinigra TaxID=235986 RepID=UPI002E362DFB|nr:hypothetical protein [Actinacidiphila glaucinigra]